MKIEKYISQNKEWFRYKYKDSKTNETTLHGMFNSIKDTSIGYFYHAEHKGFWLKIIVNSKTNQ